LLDAAAVQVRPRRPRERPEVDAGMAVVAPVLRGEEREHQVPGHALQRDGASPFDEEATEPAAFAIEHDARRRGAVRGETLDGVAVRSEDRVDREHRRDRAGAEDRQRDRGDPEQRAARARLALAHPDPPLRPTPGGSA
jgi:hypothetical protein